MRKQKQILLYSGLLVVGIFLVLFTFIFDIELIRPPSSNLNPLIGLEYYIFITLIILLPSVGGAGLVLRKVMIQEDHEENKIKEQKEESIRK